MGLKKQDATVQIFEETVSSEPVAASVAKDLSAQAGAENIKPLLEKNLGDVIAEDEREKARKEALAQLEKEVDEVADE